jgi:hypothetical protein
MSDLNEPVIPLRVYQRKNFLILSTRYLIIKKKIIHAHFDFSDSNPNQDQVEFAELDDVFASSSINFPRHLSNEPDDRGITVRKDYLFFFFAFVFLLA